MEQTVWKRILQPNARKVVCSAFNERIQKIIDSQPFLGKEKKVEMNNER